ncbi:hypothetical protein [Microbacterium sp. H83]|uniref:hypothetical protein n=1 Tax=Microbacterium sp. H83 TaxID=1827324 RepID=UPI00083396FC|nr:hypothetical protein [Microbacterium sp. H83]
MNDGALLIQQRMALRRQRNGGVYTVVSSVVFGAFWTTTVLLDGADLWPFLGVLLALVGVVIGIRQIRAASRATRAFEEQHGRRAGIQD